jgi:transposase
MPPRTRPPTPIPVRHPHAAGIDVHSDMHMVCVPPGAAPSPDPGAGLPPHVRRFGAYTADLLAIADHLAAAGVTTVAMESTGVYWIPLFEVLEARGFEVLLVEPGQLSHCGARPKTDVLDCQWIQRLHTYGLLNGSFRPPDAVLALRGYHRQRQMLIRYAAGHVRHVQKALEQMNVKLTEVVSDVMGLTGRRVVRAILAGERDPDVLAGLRDKHCKATRAEIARALDGSWRAEHVFALGQAFALVEAYEQQVAACDRRIEAELAGLPARSGDKAKARPSRTRGRKRNDLGFEAAVPLFRALGVDLTAIPGIDVGTALVILSEIGVDVSRFPTEKHFASWLGLCPRSATSNKTSRKVSPRRGKNRVAQALRMAAQAVGRTATGLGAFYRRVRGRLGGVGACTATAHKLGRLVYRMLSRGTEYVATSLAEYEARLRAQAERALRRRAANLGFELVPRAQPTPVG